MKPIIETLFSTPASFIKRVLAWNASRFRQGRKNLWVFGAWHGKEFSDNARYFFLHCVQNHPEIHSVWLTRDTGVLNEVRAAGHRCLEIGTPAATATALLAEAAFYTHGFEDLCDWNLFGNSVEINLDHGMIVKPLPRPSLAEQAVRRTKLIFNDCFSMAGFPMLPRMARYNCSLNRASLPHLEDHHYYGRPGKCVVTGYPRIDRIMAGSQKGPLVVSYLPTYRGDGPGLRPIDPFEENTILRGLDDPKLKGLMARGKMRFIIKHHGIFDIAGFGFEKKFKERYPDTAVELFRDTEFDSLEHLLGETDVLVTDYSSVWIDFLITGRPIVFACYDKEEYLARHGWRYSFDETAPGLQCADVAGMCEALERHRAEPGLLKEKRAEVKALFHDFDDGLSCERIFKFAREKLDGTGGGCDTLVSQF